MTGFARFLVFIVISAVVFLAVLAIVIKGRSSRPWLRMVLLTLIVVVGGMVFAKWGQNSGLSWTIYYTVPALLTVLAPPVALRFTKGEVVHYLVLSLLMAPAIHAFFSLLFDWHDYMPFFYVPSLRDVLGAA